jgi:hypothetical protein
MHAGQYYARTSNSLGYLDEVFNDVPCPGGICAVSSGSPITFSAQSFWPWTDFDLVPRTGVGFHTVAACRALDSRLSDGPFGGQPLAAGEDRGVVLWGLCGVPATASAVAANVTVTQPTVAGHLRLYPAGITPPGVSTVNFAGGQTRASNAVLSLGVAGEVRLQSGQPAGSGGTAHVVIDVVGYFE